MTWLIFWSSVALALAALAWVSVEVVALEKREAIAQVDATRHEAIRRALWRMDSRMTPILAIEASRPYTDYKSLEDTRPNSLRSTVADPSALAPAARSNYSYVRSYFQFEQEQDIDNQEVVDQIAGLLDSISPFVEHEEGLAIATRQDDALEQDLERSFVYADRSLVGSSVVISPSADSDFAARKLIAEIATQSNALGQIAPGNESWLKGLELDKAWDSDRGRNTDGDEDAGTNGLVFSTQFDMRTSTQLAQPDEYRIGTLHPRWIADESGTLQLVLVRSVIIDEKPVIQGIWLNWGVLRTDLLDAITDVMPNSSLIAVTGPRSSMIGGYQLATIPVEFIPAPLHTIVSWRWSPAIVGLLVTWIAILSTIIAVGAVLRAAIVLSERRGRFVSAVTHELRTPLTTFRLYSQMLADGMVSDEDVRTEYLQILKRESERLTGIVENVLEYARLNRARSSKDKAAGVQTLSPGALVARFRPALARRAGQSNLDLVVSLDLEAHQDRTLTVDPHAVERIMMNLVENACKYAAPSELEGKDESSLEDADTRIHFDISIENDTLEMLVSDHGPGIAPGEGARIFGEFQRGWRGLSNARSGLGLGLALSRGLAKEMEGNLLLVKRRGHGAEFLLTIPLDDQLSEGP